MKTFKKHSATELSIETTNEEIVPVSRIKEEYSGLIAQKQRIVAEHQTQINRIDAKLAELQTLINESDRLGIIETAQVDAIADAKL